MVMVMVSLTAPPDSRPDLAAALTSHICTFSHFVILFAKFMCSISSVFFLLSGKLEVKALLTKQVYGVPTLSRPLKKLIRLSDNTLTRSD